MARSGDGQIATANLFHVAARGDVFELRIVEADAEFTAEDGDGGGRCALCADDLFEAARNFEINWARQAVRDDRRFKRDDGAAFI
jgi:hypothetical protein